MGSRKKLSIVTDCNVVASGSVERTDNGVCRITEKRGYWGSGF